MAKALKLSYKHGTTNKGQRVHVFSCFVHGNFILLLD